MGIGGALAGLILAVAAGAAAAECRPESLSLRGGGSEMRFSVEVADDAGERATGLMNRDSLARSAGMLFVYEAPHEATFWMRNTLIPLDMIFADETGRVTRVHAEAVPLDESRIEGGPGVQYVLEINGGLAARLGISPGHEMRHPAIDQDTAAWPCAE